MNRPNDFFVTKSDDGDWDVLVLKSDWNSSVRGVLDKMKLLGLRLSESAGWQGGNVDFLRELVGSRVIEVGVYSWKIRDLSPLGRLTQLRHIGIEANYIKAPDFSTFGDLQSLFINWKEHARSLLRCTSLERLNVTRFPFVDLREISSLRRLRTLQITSRTLRRLDGISELEQITALDLSYCPKLESLDGIEHCGRINRLEFTSCKAFGDLDPLRALKDLRSLLIWNCGTVRSLEPLSECTELESVQLIGDTSIEDGDLSVLSALPKLRTIAFARKRHYSHHPKDFSK